jgi:hypothetical protein
MKGTASTKNIHDNRESWMKAAERELAPYFTSCGFELPPKIRYAIAFPSTGKNGRRIGECWHPVTSGDGHFEVIIRADIADPVEVLGVMTHELVHAVLPPDAGHGPKYKEAAIKIGLEGQMRHAMPNQLLRPKLEAIAESLGPLPHAALNLDYARDGSRPADKPKKQGTRMLKAECKQDECGYTVRLTAKWVDEIGPPHCPKHGAMTVDRNEAEAGLESV